MFQRHIEGDLYCIRNCLILMSLRTDLNFRNLSTKWKLFTRYQCASCAIVSVDSPDIAASASVDTFMELQPAASMLCFSPLPTQKLMGLQFLSFRRQSLDHHTHSSFFSPSMCSCLDLLLPLLPYAYGAAFVCRMSWAITVKFIYRGWVDRSHWSLGELLRTLFMVSECVFRFSSLAYFVCVCFVCLLYTSRCV